MKNDQHIREVTVPGAFVGDDVVMARVDVTALLQEMRIKEVNQVRVSRSVISPKDRILIFWYLEKSRVASPTGRVRVDDMILRAGVVADWLLPNTACASPTVIVW
jgi:hypothetical protein